MELGANINQDLSKAAKEYPPWPSHYEIQLTEEQIQEWVRLIMNDNTSKKWSNQDMSVKEIHEANLKYETMRTSMRATPEGKE